MMLGCLFLSSRVVVASKEEAQGGAPLRLRPARDWFDHGQIRLAADGDRRIHHADRGDDP